MELQDITANGRYVRMAAIKAIIWFDTSGLIPMKDHFFVISSVVAKSSPIPGN
jgi:hypothetical protein